MSCVRTAFEQCCCGRRLFGACGWGAFPCLCVTCSCVNAHDPASVLEAWGWHELGSGLGSCPPFLLFSNNTTTLSADSARNCIHAMPEHACLCMHCSRRQAAPPAACSWRVAQPCVAAQQRRSSDRAHHSPPDLTAHPHMKVHAPPFLPNVFCQLWTNGTHARYLARVEQARMRRCTSAGSRGCSLCRQTVPGVQWCVAGDLSMHNMPSSYVDLHTGCTCTLACMYTRLP